MNVVVLVGRIAREPDLRYTDSQMAICRTALAVDRPVKKGHDRQADFINITLFGKQAETFQKYLVKGRQIAVEGRIQTGSYRNQSGDTVYTTDIIVNRFDFIGSKNDGNQNGGTGASGNANPQGNQAAPNHSDFPEGFEAIDDDDIPFF